MSGNTFLVIAMVMAFVSAVIGLLIEKIPVLVNLKATFLTIAAILALLSGIFTLVGTKRSESETKKETDLLYKNYVDDLKEAFGVMSHRTLDQFLSEKVPASLSQNETREVISKALNKWVHDSLVPQQKKVDADAKLIYDSKMLWNESDSASAGVWNIGQLKFIRNDSVKGQNTITFWDGYFIEETGPNDHKLVHVIVDDGSTDVERSFITNNLSEKSRDLIYKYTKWYESIRPYQSTHQTYDHVIIIIMKKRDPDMSDDLLLEELKLWIGSERGGRINTEPIMIYYDQNDLKSVKTVFK